MKILINNVLGFGIDNSRWTILKFPKIRFYKEISVVTQIEGSVVNPGSAHGYVGSDVRINIRYAGSIKQYIEADLKRCKTRL